MSSPAAALPEAACAGRATRLRRALGFVGGRPQSDPELGFPRAMWALRVAGLAFLVVCVVATVVVEPRPGLSGEGPLVSLCLAGFVGGLLVGAPPSHLTPRARALALVVLALASAGLILLQQDQSSAIGGVYAATIFAALRLPRRLSAAVAVLAVGSAVAAYAAIPHGGSQIVAVALGVPPWYFVIRALRALRLRQLAAEELVEELHESRAAQAEAAAQAERGRVARDMHDVLAHSLSALSLQLEGARLLARDRHADAAVTEALDHARSLAASGLDEARRAIASMHGDELPGPEALPALIEAFDAHGTAVCALTITGTPAELPSDARLALYRTAQEALTNVRKHADPQRVDVMLAYARDGVTLQVRDGGGPPPAPAGPGGYGLSGMRERAELLGGRLSAGPTADGFAVELWLPA